MVTVWRGREANALRVALRMSLDDFAAHLGASRRGVTRWVTRPETRLRWDTQRALDHALATATPEARQRFHARAADESASAGRATVAALGGRGAEVARWLGAVLIPPPRPTGAVPPALFRLEKAVANARLGFQACRYEQTAAELPALMRALAEARADAAQRFPERLPRLASAAQQVAASLLLKVGDVPLAVLAARQALHDAHDTLTAAAATRAMAEVLTSAGHPDRALALESAIEGDSPRELSLRGASHLTRAIAHAHLGKTSPDLAMAEQLARHVDGNFAWTGFGPANVALHRAIVARVLGDGGAAKHELSKVDPCALPFPERREAYFFEVAFASTPASSRC